jgi:hypothetical protein
MMSNALTPISLYHAVMPGGIFVPSFPETPWKCKHAFCDLSEPLLHAPCYGPQVAIDFARILTQDQAHNGFLRNVYVLEPTQNVYLLVG